MLHLIYFLSFTFYNYYSKIFRKFQTLIIKRRRRAIVKGTKEARQRWLVLCDSVKRRSELPNVQNFFADNAPIRDPLFDELDARHFLRNSKIIEPHFRFFEAVEGNGVCD